MNAVAIRQSTALRQHEVPSFNMNDMERIANAIAQGGLFGSKDPYAVLTLCLLAQAENKHPALVMQDFHIISGKPAKKAEAMQRDFLAAGGKIEWHQLDDDCADATFSHPAGGVARITWDKARVAQAQLGANPMHKKYPRQMLRSRVISEGVRTVFPGATSGLYESGEVADMQDAPATPAAPQAQRARDLKPATVEQPKVENKGRQSAEDWTDDFIAKLDAAATPGDIPALHDAKAKRALTKLSSDHPDLYDRVMAAMGTAETRVTAEGRTDEQHGDAFSDDERITDAVMAEHA